MSSFQNLALLQNLYRLKAIGFDYIDPFEVNHTAADIENIDSLTQLSNTIHSCHLCDLSKSRKQSMSGFGSNKSSLMIIDFCVSATEDSSNSYYTGRSKEILKNMIEKVLNLRLEDVYITHMVKCKPLHANTPSQSEIDSCRPHLLAQIKLLKPKVIVTLGKEAYEYFSNDHNNFNNVRGHIIDLKNYKLIPIEHPQRLLRNPQLKKIAFKDLQTIKSCL